MTGSQLSFKVTADEELDVEPPRRQLFISDNLPCVSLAFLHFWTFFSRYLYSEETWKIVSFQSKRRGSLLFIRKDLCSLRSGFLSHSGTHCMCRHAWGFIHIALRNLRTRGIDANMLMLMLFAVF